MNSFINPYLLEGYMTKVTYIRTKRDKLLAIFRILTGKVFIVGSILKPKDIYK